MNIAVLIKQVPVSNNVSVDPETHALVRGTSEGMINPADLNALEEAIKLKEKTDGEVVVFTMGPPDAEKSLRDAMAMGCDKSCLITDRVFAGGDTIATAKVIVNAIKKYGNFDLLLCGALSSDGATGQVGSMVAEYLGIPHLAEVQGISYDVEKGEVVEALKKYQGAVVKLQCELPALATVCFGCNEPRLATLRTKRAAKSKPMEVYTNLELNMEGKDAGLAGSPTIVTDSFAPEQTKKAKLLQGTPEEMAKKILELIEIEKGKN
ncbi:MAG: electron transfer flavoprotein subunit beta/FixA family protein [Clostridium sp.]